MDTVENSKLIAIFMNYPTKERAGRIGDNLAKTMYNDWSSLMRVVDTIEGLEGGFRDYSVNISKYKVQVVLLDAAGNPYGLVADSTFRVSRNQSKVQCLRGAVISFIEYYNTLEQ